MTTSEYVRAIRDRLERIEAIAESMRGLMQLADYQKLCGIDGVQAKGIVRDLRAVADDIDSRSTLKKQEDTALEAAE